MPKQKASHANRLTGAQFAEVMQLLRDVDSVELKLMVPVEEHRATIAGLPLDPVEAEPRQVFFFDTPDLALNRAGVVVRARRMRGGIGDTVIKLRPVVPSELPDALRHSPNFKLEVDSVPAGVVCSGSLKGQASGDEVRDLAAGTLKLSRLLSKEQKAFYRTYAPAGVSLDSLSILGPTFALKSVFQPKQLGRKVVLEWWFYPDGSRILELSTKSAPAEGPSVGAELRAYLTKRGVTISSGRKTKTGMALALFAAQLRKAQAAQRPARGGAAARKRPAAAAKRRAAAPKRSAASPKR